MTSSTDMLSACNDQESQSPGDVQDVGRCIKNQESKPVEVSEDVQEEINELLENVPQVAAVFDIINKIGSGTFSSVYVASLKNHPGVKEKFALKHIIPTSHPSRIENELRCLHEIGGVDNVMGVKACFREQDHVVIVMPYFPHERFQDYVQSLTLGEAREYMRNLLLSLRRVHEVDIIHRDVKPSNFLYNKEENRFALVDFGLAQKAPVPLQKSEHTVQLTVVNPKSGPASPMAQSQASPTKRKPTTSENVRTSPRKKRLVPEDAKPPLVEIDTNVPKLGITEPVTCLSKAFAQERDGPSRDAEANEKLAPAGDAIFKPTYKAGVRSPRRMVLTKRALDVQRKELFDGPSVSKAADHKAAAPAAPGAASGKKCHTIVVERGGRSMYRSVAPVACDCFGHPRICSVCMSRIAQNAPRAGTPGFRAPEVLMKCPDQTTAVDVWSAGVILLSLLSGRYPFFRAPDDMTALAQVIVIFGTDTVRDAAMATGKNLLSSPRIPPVNLRILCERLRGRTRSSKVKAKNSEPSTCVDKKNSKNGGWSGVPDSAFDLLTRLLDVNPYTRISAAEALQHDFFTKSA